MKHTMQKALGAVAATAALALFSCAAFAQSASADGEIRKIDAKANRSIPIEVDHTRISVVRHESSVIQGTSYHTK